VHSQQVYVDNSVNLLKSFNDSFAWKIFWFWFPWSFCFCCLFLQENHS